MKQSIHFEKPFMTCVSAIGSLWLFVACAAAPVTQEVSTTMGSPAQARNVILFIGDGMGISTVTAMRILAGQLAGGSGEDHVLSFENFQNVALVKTYSSNQQVSDSAATATAILTGVKTKVGFIGLAPQATRGDCYSSRGAELKAILQMADEAGLSTGIVTTARITHGTPAAAFAHGPERNWEADVDIPEAEKEAGCVDFARQLVEFSAGDGIEVMLGGGRQNFLPNTVADPENPANRGRRGDGRNLVTEWQVDNPGGRYIWNKQDFDAVDPAVIDKLLGLFEFDHMQYEADRETGPMGEPSLSQMTRTAIDMLAHNQKGYFLLVEGGRIDHAHHESNAYRALTDGVEMANAVALASEMTSPEDTLIIVTADHSHTFSIAGYPTRGNPILGKVIGNDDRGEPMTEPSLSDDGKPYTTLGYYVSPGGLHDKVRPDLTGVDTEHPDYHQQAAVFRLSGTHAGEDVAAYARGPNAAAIHGVMEQHQIFKVMRDAYGFGDETGGSGQRVAAPHPAELDIRPVR